MLEREPTRETSNESHRPLENLPKMAPNSVLELAEENWVKSLSKELRKANEKKRKWEKTP